MGVSQKQGGPNVDPTILVTRNPKKGPKFSETSRWGFLKSRNLPVGAPCSKFHVGWIRFAKCLVQRGEYLTSSPFQPTFYLHLYPKMRGRPLTFPLHTPSTSVSLSVYGRSWLWQTICDKLRRKSWHLRRSKEITVRNLIRMLVLVFTSTPPSASVRSLWQFQVGTHPRKLQDPSF